MSHCRQRLGKNWPIVKQLSKATSHTWHPCGPKWNANKPCRCWQTMIDSTHAQWYPAHSILFPFFPVSFERIPFNLYLRKRNIPPHPFCPCCQHMSFRRCITEKNKGWCEYLTDSLKWRQDDPALKQRIKMSFQPCKTIQPFQSTFVFMSVDRKIMKRTDTEW